MAVHNKQLVENTNYGINICVHTVANPKGWNEDFFDSPFREGIKPKKANQNAQRVYLIYWHVI